MMPADSKGASSGERSGSRECLVVVDLQRAFPVPAELVEQIRAQAETYSHRIFTRFINLPDSLFRRKLGLTACAPGSAESELLIEPRPTDWVLEKPSYGFRPDHLRKFAEAGITRAVVCGIDTDACVLAVAFTLFDAGIDCRVEPDLCWSANGLHHEAISILRKQIGS